MSKQQEACERVRIQMHTLHGELYLDDTGKAHFICHTPGTMGFHESRAGLLKFIELLQEQVDRERECPWWSKPPGG